MKNSIFTVLPLALVAVAAVGGKTNLPVVDGAQALSVNEKAGVDGECGCTPHATKPGYGFGAKVPHYGPPGQGFNPYYTWRDQREVSDYTPKGNPLPPKAFTVK